MTDPTPPELEQWANNHWITAQSLAAAKDPWASVAAFYSIYPLLRAALIADPVFQDFKTLKSISSYLTPDDRFVTKHDAGAKRQTTFGLNQLCTAIYPHITAEYHFCHVASVQVRYKAGMTKPYSLDGTITQAQKFRVEYNAGNLVHTVSRMMSTPK